MMNLQDRLKVLLQLGEHLQGEDERLAAVMHRSQYHNPWFTISNQQQAVQAIATQFLTADRLSEWLDRYELPAHPTTPRRVGLVLAGNIPLVGFHDWLCTFVSGHRAQLKLSEKDAYLLPYLLQVLTSFDVRVADYYQVVQKLENFDAVIATGSNNSARYFKAYFGKKPHIIRQNRNAVAVLDGSETTEQLAALGNDVFQYFGLGCRNVSKLYVPDGYDFTPLLEALHEYREIVLHPKYRNNFDYNYALFILNKAQFQANGCVILHEDPAIASRIACLHYETYPDVPSVAAQLKARQSEIQCVVAAPGLPLDFPTFPFGHAQQPALWDYADGVDTLAFLADL